MNNKFKLSGIFYGIAAIGWLLVGIGQLSHGSVPMGIFYLIISAIMAAGSYNMIQKSK